MYQTGQYYLYKEPMNLRAQPRASGTKIGIIPQGTCITVTEISDNWGRTEYGGRNGWCCISECFARRMCEEAGCYQEKYREKVRECEELKRELARIRANLQ